MAEALKTRVDNIEEIPEELQKFYEQTEKGNYVLAIDGVPPQAQAKIAEFRDNNITLVKEKEELEERLKNYEGLDADRAREAMERVAAIEEQELVKAGDIESLVEQRLSTAKKEHLKQLESVRSAKEEAEKKAAMNQKKLSEYLIENKILQAVHEVATPHQAALPDIIYRAKSQWRLADDGGMYAVDEFGNKQYAKGSEELVSPSEWARNLVDNARHLFAASVGTNSSGSGKAAKVTKNPFLPENRNLAEQTKLFREDPNLAVRLAKEAGVELAS